MLKRIVLIVTILIGLTVSCLVGVIYYYYTHPDAVASLIKQYISKTMNVSIAIKHLSYSISPLRIQAEGMRLTPLRGSSGFHMDVPQMAADLSFRGSFGRKALVVDKIEVSEFSLSYNKADFHLASKPPPSVIWWGPLLKRGVALLLFRDIRIDAVTLSGGNIIAKLNGPIFHAKNVSIHRRADKQIELESTARLYWPKKEIDINIPKLRLFTQHALSLSDLTMDASLLAQKMILKHAETKLSDVGLKVDGKFDFKRQQIDISRLAVSVSDQFNLRGFLNIAYSPQPHVKLTVESSEFSPEYIISILPDRLKKTLLHVDLGGRVSAEGSFDAIRKGNAWKWGYRLKSHLSNNHLTYRTDHERMNGKISGRFGVSGNLSEVNVSADLKMMNSEFSSRTVQAEFPEIGFSVTGKYPVFQLKDVSVRVSNAKMLKSETGRSLAGVRLHAPSGVINVHKRTFRFLQLQMNSPLTGNIQGMIETNGKEIHIQMKGKDTRMFTSLKDFELLPSGWQFGGHHSVLFDATLKQGKILSFDSQINFKKLQIQDASGVFAGENLSVELLADGTLDVEDASIAGTTSVSVTDGEILYDLFYINLRDNNFTASAQASYDHSNMKVGLTEVSLELKDILSMTAAGSLIVKEPFLTRLTVQIPSNPLSPLFQVFLREPFGGEKPYLKDIKVDGHVSTDLELTGSAGDWSIRGIWRWRDGDLSFKDKALSARGINMDYPVWYQSRALQRELKPLEGKLSIDSVSLPFLSEQPLQFIIEAIPNQVLIPVSTRVKISKGSVVVGPITVRDLFSSNASAETSLTVNKSDMSAFISTFWPHPMPATIAGRLERISIDRERVETQGKLVVEAFDGITTLSEIGGERFISTAPLVKLNADFDGLKLGQMTTDTPVGRIDGVLRGHIKNLEIAYGQPQQFDLLLETEKRKGVKQKISIQAIDTIARIGGGQSPFMGFGGIITSFYETLSYEKIGIRSTLKNDLFRINGTIVEGKKEYMMKGSGLSGVNIINHNPNNRIRFKDMIKRIERITEGEKPVIR